MVKYKIGQLTKTMGVSSHLLKHYEKFDLLCPCKDEGTNYRYYKFNQLGRLIQCKKYRNVGFTIKETSQILNHYNNDALNQTLKDHLAFLECELEKLAVSKVLTQQLYEDSTRFDRHEGQWFIEMMPATYLLRQSNNLELIEDNHSTINGKNLLDYVPTFQSILYLQKECLQNSLYMYHWCLGLDAKHRELFDSVIDERFIKVEDQRALVLYIKVSVPYINNEQLLEKIKEHYIHLPFECHGDLLAVLLKSTFEDDKQYEYFKIYIPIL
ncbi:MAG TPA: MerR family transcriptional regulator [Firmicutes bacterium]|nr:MerR family transcriptional regulator [Bacillota bacterium]